MNCEANVHSDCASDAETVQLRRNRNSLSNTASVPPEILGYIFQFVIAPDPPVSPAFSGVQKDSYKFLFVCRHWHQVARVTPELWASWGNNLEDWKRFYNHSGTSSLDLVLDGIRYRERVDLDEDLQAALRDRAARDVVRKVHLRCWDRELSTSILSSLTSEEDGVRHSSIESIILDNADVSGFFARHRLPKLRNLTLSRCTGLVLDHLQYSTSLVQLCLHNEAYFSVPPLTASHIISLLASNPSIRILEIQSRILDDDGGHSSRNRVPLRHLKDLCLKGRVRDISPILDRLEIPDTVKEMRLVMSGCTLEEAMPVIKPCARDYTQRNPRPQDKLGVSIFTSAGDMSFSAHVVGTGYCGPLLVPQANLPHACFTTFFSRGTSWEDRKKACSDILALFPQDKIIYFATNSLDAVDMTAVLPNLKFLHLHKVKISDGFLLPEPDGLKVHKNLFPSLQRLYLEDTIAKEDNWSPLVHFLTEVLDEQPISLSVFGDGAHICLDAFERIESLVSELTYIPEPDFTCPLSGCNG